MSDQEPAIVIVRDRIDAVDLERLTAAYFEDMVKYVVDLKREVIAVGGDMHTDAEQVLLADGSSHSDLWGANYYPGRGPGGCLEYTSLINIRPADDNPSMEVEDPQLRENIREITFKRIGCGDEETP